MLPPMRKERGLEAKRGFATVGAFVFLAAEVAFALVVVFGA